MVTSGSLSLALHDWGGDGPPTLLAHPTGFHGRAWAPVAELLVAAGRRVWSFDFRGHGDSDRSAEGYSWHGFADDVLAVVDDLGIAGAPGLVGVGHSKGGTALMLAEMREPGTFPKLWCFEPIFFPTDDELPPHRDNPLTKGALKRRADWGSVEEAIESYSSRPPLNVLRADALRAYVEYGLRRQADGSFELKCRPEDEAEIYAMGIAHGGYRRLAEVKCPVVVACGEHTDAITPALAEMIVARLPHGRVEVMTGLGHFGPMQDPDAIAASILRFSAES
ncbi:MAG TPA: alpha/beta hydrolase [Acidimicrobiia bacterium]|nr:alpha/beta hydrolase [Acidimicrobiia bacterium]